MLRIAGITATAVLAVCLGAVAIAMSGGPSAPLTQWAVPRPAGTAGHDTAHGAGQAGVTASPAPSGGTRSAATAPGGGLSASPAPSASASAGATVTPSPAASASAAPAATNPAGRTPPGHTPTKSANPHASASVA